MLLLEKFLKRLWKESAVNSRFNLVAKKLIGIQFENPIEHTCDVLEGQSFVSIDAERPDGFCDSAWDSVFPFVEKLANGEGKFYDGWMKNPMSAMISCNDGFRPVSFLLETLD